MKHETKLEPNPEFKRWLAEYFIKKGRYKITERGYQTFGEDEQRLHTEFGEICSDRERENVIETRTKIKNKGIAEQRIEKKIENGLIAELYDNELVTPKPSWNDEKYRIDVIKQFVKLLNKDKREIIKEDLYKNGISGIFRYCGNSVYLILKEAGLADFEPWEMKTTPMSFYKSKENRLNAIKWLVKRVGKDVKYLSSQDVCDNGLDGLLVGYYKGCVFLALKEAELVNYEPWEMKMTPKGFFKSVENRILATKWLVNKLGKNPIDITSSDFSENGLVGLFDYYKRSPYRALKEAGFVQKPDEMKNKPQGFYKSRENRIKTTKWLVEVSGKDPKTITAKDFYDYEIARLLAYCKYSPYLALKEAGLVQNPEEMKHKPKNKIVEEEKKK